MRDGYGSRRPTRSRVHAHRVRTLTTALLLAVAGCGTSDPVGPGEVTVQGTLVHVDAQRGADSNPGSSDAPFASIGGALANTSGEVTIYVAGGRYPELLTPRSNAHVYGGFDGVSWSRTGERTVVGAGSTAARIANVSSVTLDGLTLVASDAGRRNPSSVGVVIHAASGVVMRGNDLVAGRGFAGGAGQDRSRPSKAGNGGAGEDDAICGPSLNLGGAGGSGTPGHNGGAGGDGKWPRGVAGEDGKGPNGGAAGPRGDVQADGHDGKTGGAGSDGDDGDGGDSFGGLAGGGYTPANGAPGESGTHGSGGGGGGGGSGSDGFTCGSAGGGGGEGGTGGAGGGAGTGGGGSFGVIVTGDAAVRLTGNRIETSGGGDGGRGGRGAAGGAGGSGGAGGTQGLFGGWDGGDGGDGGSGGSGGDGGGGGGGPSIGIATDGIGTITQSSNSFLIGPAGAGGASDAQPGADGVAAELHGTG